MKKIEGGVMAAKGFKAAGVEANIKYSGRKDMAIVYSESACTSGGVFTSNVVKAAPVYWESTSFSREFSHIYMNNKNAV